ncbi:bifunctional glycosyltransferase family 2 protein/CDP-glycerol:glycerophosphate glycerophosphotransferase [Streptomyces sp. NBC_00056]|uniref:bifunctional glycosyltransferase/CDP-glycerol:glycerophosphate glycerophosphotransferase n=1 Tax=unclassified Streptomyces TaxID=2593676 RepID=UPI002E81529F|nr:bifunctional glycosyltransferase family 2 protein/CDP-glycerol:glycerophosphate glycerophosphotransferase [Streptomyces sp. NBC_00569]WUB92229.1 bifunctional glycosyltransferase family 2 protein/CDP-glycerol:glycerophosphate glycerophosphotransferase [Streptomyces sp. NBC_00569]
MPRFSVIVPVYKVQGYLRECLDSILTQSCTDIEVIAVDDCSPDNCGAIIDEYAARDARVTAVHLPQNVGLGRARNAGAGHATGDYLLFLDSDDSYTPGALQAIEERLTATDDPDILVFDHVRTHWWGRGGRSMTADLLASAGTDTFDIVSSPQYLHLFLVAWNKAYRRDFFTGHGFTYRPGLYEDAPVTYQALMSARRIGCLDRVCVEYLQRRSGAITRTPGRRHFDIFTQYSGLFAFLDDHPEMHESRPLLFERMINHFLATMPLSERVLPEDRSAFYRETVDFYRRHKPDGFTPPDDAYRAQWRLIARSPYSVFQAYALAERLGRASLRKQRKLCAATTRQVKRAYAGTQRRLRLDPNLAVYSASWHRGVLGDPAAVHEAARMLAPHIDAVWVVRPDAVAQLPSGIDYVTPDTPRYHRVTSRATYFVNNVDWTLGLVKRPGQIHVHTHEGTPLGHMGVDLLSRPAAKYRADVRAQLRRADRWDFSLVSSPYAQQIWDRAYPCHFTSLPTGAPRNDVLVRGDHMRKVALRKRLGVPDGNTVVLYAPTRRDHRKSYVPRLDFEQLLRGLGPTVTLLVRLHPKDAQAPFRGLQLRDLQRRGLLLDVTDEPSAVDMMLVSDALVTDYSSLLFDYANTDRPIIVHGDDWEAYRAARGVYFDVLADPPGHVTTTTDELTDLFASGAWQDARSAALRADFRRRFCPYDDGHAAARVVSLVMLGREHPPSVIPQQDARQLRQSARSALPDGTR